MSIAATMTLAALTPPAGTWAYLPFLLVWALPVIAVQWLAGGRYLWRERGRWPWIVLGLTIYFTLADAAAIAAGTWRFDARALMGLALGPVPVEEVLFYLLTGAMVVQGFVIAWGAWGERAELLARWRGRRAGLRSWRGGRLRQPPAQPGTRDTALSSGQASSPSAGYPNER